MIGYGNTLRGDDGIGWVAAEQLRACLNRANVTILSVHQLTMELAEPISQAEYVFLLDASTGETAGEIQVRPLNPDRSALDPLHHHMPPAVLLAYAQALYGSVPPTWLYTITAETYDFGETLSPAVAEAMPAFVAQVNAHITSL